MVLNRVPVSKLLFGQPVFVVRVVQEQSLLFVPIALLPC